VDAIKEYDKTTETISTAVKLSMEASKAVNESIQRVSNAQPDLKVWNYTRTNLTTCQQDLFARLVASLSTSCNNAVYQVATRLSLTTC
jgi:hypothetical protein